MSFAVVSFAISSTSEVLAAVSATVAESAAATVLSDATASGVPAFSCFNSLIFVFACCRKGQTSLLSYVSQNSSFAVP